MVPLYTLLPNDPNANKKTRPQNGRDGQKRLLAVPPSLPRLTRDHSIDAITGEPGGG